MNQSIVIPIVVAIVVLVILGLIVWLAATRFRSMRLKRKYGPEYDYALEKLGDKRTAEADLTEREKRVKELELHDLNDHDRERYHTEWTDIQANFVDNPSKAVQDANRLITEVMVARGFPVADFEQRSADLSVLYPNFVPMYREANSLVDKNQGANVNTEELRKAMMDFHSLFDQLVRVDHSKPVTQPKETTEATKNQPESQQERDEGQPEKNKEQQTEKAS